MSSREREREKKGEPDSDGGRRVGEESTSDGVERENGSIVSPRRRTRFNQSASSLVPGLKSSSSRRDLLLRFLAISFLSCSRTVPLHFGTLGKRKESANGGKRERMMERVGEKERERERRVCSVTIGKEELRSRKGGGGFSSISVHPSFSLSPTPSSRGLAHSLSPAFFPNSRGIRAKQFFPVTGSVSVVPREPRCHLGKGKSGPPLCLFLLYDLRPPLLLLPPSWTVPARKEPW